MQRASLNTETSLFHRSALLALLLSLGSLLAFGCAKSSESSGGGECGDGVVDTGEECDDGNTVGGDGCDATCQLEETLPTCGDGTIDDGEECDDGELNSDTEPDACREDCSLPYCGDGVVDTGEECDPPGASCSQTCQDVGSCGDGVCDDGEGETAESCPQDCSVCGDDLCSPGEDIDTCPEDCVECGDGVCSPSEDLSSCPEDCGSCGDGVCDQDEDETTCPQDCAVCGDGVCSSTEDESTCPQDCAVCGDGVCSSTEDSSSCPSDCANCGDGVCSSTEDESSCPQDCAVCGDGVCSSTEDESTCPQDCAVCGDGVCSSTEDSSSCPSDCANCGDGVCSSTENESSCPQDCAVCGDGVCSSTENESTCPQDCAICGDGVCSSTENESTCPQDCVVCGDGVCSSTENESTCPQDCAVCGDGVCSSTEDSNTCPQDCAVCVVSSDITSDLGEGSVTGNSASGNDGVDASCVTGTAQEVVYSLTPSFTGNLVVELDHPGTDYDTALALIEGDCASGTEVACNDDYTGLESRLNTAVTSGSLYHVVVEGYNGATGNYELTVHQEGVCEGVGPVVNITDTFTESTTLLDTSTGVASLAGACGGDSAPDGRVYFTAPTSGLATASTANPGTDYDTRIYAREGTCDSQNYELACNDDFDGLQSQVDFNVTAGTDYHVIVDGFGSGSGNAEVTVTFNPSVGALGSCSSSTTDIYTVEVTAGDSLYVKGDTIDAATAGDLRMLVYDTDGTTIIGSFDDELTCTYPPPSFACPEGTITSVPNSGTVEIHIYSLSSCADTSNVGYELTVELNGQPVPIKQTQFQ